jgi:hypothetical protein
MDNTGFWPKAQQPKLMDKNNNKNRIARIKGWLLFLAMPGQIAPFPNKWKFNLIASVEQPNDVD